MINQMTINQLCKLVRGSSPRPSGDPRYYGGNVPRLMVKDVSRDGMYVTPKIDSLTEEGAAKSRPMSKGDLVVAVSGDPGEPSILAVDACIHDGFVGLRELQVDKVFTPYLYRYFKYNKEVSKSQAVGAIYKNLNTDQIKALKIPLPPLDQQKNIASILDAADEYRQKTKALIAKYDELTQSLFLDMFGDPVTNPKGWKEKPMGELADLKMGGTPSTKHPEYYENGTINWMKSGDIKGDFITNFPNKITQLGLESSNTKLYNENTVVIALNGQGKTRGTTGLITESTCSNQSVANIDPGNNMNSTFLHFQLKSRYKLIRNLTGDNDRSGLNLTILRNYKIFTPELDIQNQFAERVQALEAQKAQAQESLAKAEDLFNSLLQKAFKGELA